MMKPLSIMKLIVIVGLSLLTTCMLVLMNLLVIVRNPIKRIVLFYNIVRKRPLNRDGKAPPAHWNDPSLGEHGFIHLDGIKLHYVESGDKDKPLMLFLHGFFDCWYTWRYQIREFSKNYRVVAVDMRGYSLSDCPEGKENYTRVKNATDVANLVEALGYKDCILVGYDWGNAIAMETVTLFPDKVSKIILLNGVAPATYVDHCMEELADSQHFSTHMVARVPYMPEFMLAIDDFKFLESPSVRRLNMAKEDLEVYKYALSQQGVIYALYENYRSLFTQTKIIRHKTDWNILLIHGTKEEYVKKIMVEESKAYYPNGVFKTVEGGTHFMHEDQPHLVNEIINDYLNI